LDPVLAVGMHRLANAFGGPLRMHNLAQHRAALLGARPSMDWLEHRAIVESVSVPRPAEASELELLVLRPKPAGRSLPAIYHLHAGGMVMGDNRHGLDAALEWAATVRAVVIAPDYRLAPEHPHPAPSEDCYAGLQWVAANAQSLGVDPTRIVVAGSSAGGGLAAALCLMARDRGGPALRGQLLVGPMLDDRLHAASGQEFDGFQPWDRLTDEFAWSALLGPTHGRRDVTPYAAPARALSLVGLPAAFLDVGSAEVFRDPTVDYAVRLWQAGGAAELHVWPGAFHGFDRVVPEARVSQAARQARVDWLRRLLF
jgi:acetyl esterase/lipase